MHGWQGGWRLPTASSPSAASLVMLPPSAALSLLSAPTPFTVSVPAPVLLLCASLVETLGPSQPTRRATDNVAGSSPAPPTTPPTTPPKHARDLLLQLHGTEPRQLRGERRVLGRRGGDHVNAALERSARCGGIDSHAGVRTRDAALHVRTAARRTSLGGVGQGRAAATRGPEARQRLDGEGRDVHGVRGLSLLQAERRAAQEMVGCDGQLDLWTAAGG